MANGTTRTAQAKGTYSSLGAKRPAPKAASKPMAKPVKKTK